VNVETAVAGLKIGSGLAVVLVVDGVTNNGVTVRGGTVVTLTSMLYNFSSSSLTLRQNIVCS
jgi:hypothetical protein